MARRHTPDRHSGAWMEEHDPTTVSILAKVIEQAYKDATARVFTNLTTRYDQVLAVRWIMSDEHAANEKGWTFVAACRFVGAEPTVIREEMLRELRARGVRVVSIDKDAPIGGRGRAS